MSTYGGAAVFGRSVAIDMTPLESEAQVSAFFGVNGRFSLWGGGRGRVITVSGVLTAASYPLLAAAEGLLLSYDDGVARVLYDSVRQVSYPHVVFTGAYRRTGRPGPTVGGVAQPYSAVFSGLL